MAITPGPMMRYSRGKCQTEIGTANHDRTLDRYAALNERACERYGKHRSR